MTKKLRVFFASLLCLCLTATFGLTACGQDGKTPQIGDNGDWFIGETDTGVKAEGAQGVGIKNVTINTEGKLVITLTNDEVLTLGKVVGESGEAGKGVKSFEINGEGKLVVTYSDDTTETLDKVVGNDGRSITDAHIDDAGNLVLEFNEGDDVTAGSVKGVGIKNIEIANGKFKITMTDDEVIELDIPTQTHTHSLNKIESVTPTCTTVGYDRFECTASNCPIPSRLIYEFKPATGHTFADSPDVEIPATCTHKGLKTYICETCGALKGEETPVTAHKYGSDGNCIYCGQKKPSITLNVTAGGSAEVDIPAGTATGVQIIEADLGDTKLSTGRLKMNVSGKEVKSELVFSESRSEEHHNVYFGYIQIAEGDSKITFNAENENINNAELTFKAYEMPTLKADGTSIEVPVNLIGKDELKFNVDTALQAATYTLKVECTADKLASSTSDSAYGRLTFWLGKNVNINSSSYNGYSVTLSTTEISNLEGANHLGYVKVNNANKPAIYPITITLTAASS